MPRSLTTRSIPPTKRFEALVDSGASRCIFHSSLGKAIGLDVAKGEVEETVGVSGLPTVTYLHDVSLYVANQIIKIRAGFTDQLPLSGLLGRSGFFEHFKIIFDPSSEPPGFTLERIHKA
jgi:aspartyl protease